MPWGGAFERKLSAQFKCPAYLYARPPPPPAPPPSSLTLIGAQDGHIETELRFQISFIKRTSSCSSLPPSKEVSALFVIIFFIHVIFHPVILASCYFSGHQYGRGVYFARHAQCSLRFAANRERRAGTQSRRYMYLARVLVGQYCIGNSTMKVPPPKNPSRPEILHESVVDDQANPSIFEVFFDNQCYPEYLITMQ